jgi:hypothetical protein
VEEAVETLAVALHHLGEAGRRASRGSTRRTCCRSIARESLAAFARPDLRPAGAWSPRLSRGSPVATIFNVASPAATATGFPDSVPPGTPGPSGASFSMMSRRPPRAPERQSAAGDLAERGEVGLQP